MTLKQILAALKAWGVSHKNHLAKLHVILIAALEHVKEHGDVTPLNVALQAIPLKHGPLFTGWLKKYTPVIPKDATSFKLHSKGVWNIDGAKTEAYYTMGSQSNVTEFDVEKYIKSVISKVRKEHEMDNFQTDKIRELVSGLSDLTAEARHVDPEITDDQSEKEEGPFSVDVETPPPAMVQESDRQAA